MKTVKVTALQTHVYDNLLRVAGEVYSVRAEDLETLVLVGSVQVKGDESEAGTYNRRDLRAK